MVFNVFYQRCLHLLGVLLFLAVLFVSGCASPSQGTDASNAGSSLLSAPCLTSIEAMNSVGKTTCVEFFVGNASQYQGIVYLNEKADYIKGFQAVILADSAVNFKDPVSQYRNKTIRVSGLIVEYDGHPGIIVKSPSDITVK
jgi:hypothetical protein